MINILEYRLRNVMEFSKLLWEIYDNKESYLIMRTCEILLKENGWDM